MTAKTAIIIGGGIAGCSTAYALAQRGIQVTLLERNAEIASEASGNPLAMLYPRLSSDDATSAFALAAYLYSLQLYRSLDLSSDDFDCCGMLQLGFNAKELARIQKVSSQGYAGNILQYLDKTEASALAGIRLDHDALHFPGAAWVNPRQLCRSLSQHKNIHTVTHENVNRVLKAYQTFEVHTEKNTILKADIAVIANANNARLLCPVLPMAMQAVRGQVSLVKPAESSRHLQKIVCSDGYFSPAAYKKGLESLHCLGATFSNLATTEHSQDELVLEQADHQANLDKLDNISAALHADLKHNIMDGRVSLRCTAIDYWPLAGQLLDADALKARPPRPGTAVDALPWVDGLYMNIAHGSKGFTTAPLCAELIASMICKTRMPMAEDLAGLLNPNRFLLKAMGLKRLAKMIAA